MLKRKPYQGFTLIQMSVLLAAAALVLVAVLPGTQNTNNSNAVSASKMNNIMNALRSYEVAHGGLPCPADPTLATGNSGYGVSMSNGGTGTGGNCVNSSGSQVPYADTTNHIALGMVPVKTLGLSYDAALDGFGRDITYAVDTNAAVNTTAGSCWPSSSLPGTITIVDSSVNQNSVVALVSHGADGFGAWLPAQGTGGSGTALRFNSGSTDQYQAYNAEVTQGTLTPLATFQPLYNKAPTSTFDDLVVYKNQAYNLNALPVSNANTALTLSTPSPGTYGNGQTLTFTVTFPQNVTISTSGGTPYLTLSALSCSSSTYIGGSNGCSATGKALYTSGSGTTALTFTYTVLSTDAAPNGISVASGITLNGGTFSGYGSNCFSGQSLPNVILSNAGGFWLADYSNNRVVKFSKTGAYLLSIGTGSGSGNYQFSGPIGVTVDSSGNVWVLDGGNSRLMEYTSSGTFIKSIGSYGFGNGQFEFGCAAEAALDSSNNLWVTDQGNGRVEEFNSSTGAYMSQFATTYSGANLSAAGIAIEGTTIYLQIPGETISTIHYCGLYTCTIGSCSSTGITPATGYGTTWGCGTAANDFSKKGQQGCDSDYMSVDSSGNLWMSDETNSTIHEFSSAGVYIGNLNFGSNNPGGITGQAFVDTTGNAWVSSENANELIYINISNGTLGTTISSANGISFVAPQLGNNYTYR